MLKPIFFIIGLVFILGACKKSIQTIDKTEKKPTMSIEVSHKTPSDLTDDAQKEIENWKEYNDVVLYLDRFKKITPNEALNFAIELKDLTKKLKDSIKIKDFKTASFKARVNVLENEALRLADMTLIPAITAKEVNTQIDKYLLVFSSLNDKINTIYQKKEFDKEVNLDSFFVLDTSEKTLPKPKNKKMKIYDEAEQRANPIDLNSKKGKLLQKKSLLKPNEK